MKIALIGPGGIGAFYGMILHEVGCDVKFIARTNTLEYLKENKMKVTHPNYTIEDYVDAFSLDEFIQKHKADDFDAIILATKAMATEHISKSLALWVENSSSIPYYISLQNGVENEDIMATYYPKEYVIGGLTRLIVSHTISTGHVHCEGSVETLIGAISHTAQNKEFLENFKAIIDKTQTKTIICEDIKKELWTKLIVNNGVNAICALLEEESGPLLKNEKTTKLIYGLMSEAALASNAYGIDLSQDDAKRMYELYKDFQSVKPSMWQDKQNNRDLELNEICGAVIRGCEKQDLDAPYTRTISTVLEFLYEKQRVK